MTKACGAASLGRPLCTARAGASPLNGLLKPTARRREPNGPPLRAGIDSYDFLLRAGAADHAAYSCESPEASRASFSFDLVSEVPVPVLVSGPSTVALSKLMSRPRTLLVCRLRPLPFTLVALLKAEAHLTNGSVQLVSTPLLLKSLTFLTAKPLPMPSWLP